MNTLLREFKLKLKTDSYFKQNIYCKTLILLQYHFMLQFSLSTLNPILN